MWKSIICVMMITGLSGCASADLAPSKELKGPAKFAMSSIAPLPEPVPGKSCAVDNAQVRNVAGARGEQVITLQNWVRRVIKGTKS